MPTTGETITGALADSLDSVVSQARIVREFKGDVAQLADRVTLGVGVGLTWKEVSLAQLVASGITETTLEDNPQQLSDTPFSITPQMASVMTAITDRVARTINPKTLARIGVLGQNAIERKKNADGITQIAAGTTTLAGTGTTLTAGHIAAGAVRIRGNATEGWDGPVAFVLHAYQMKDLYDEMIAGIGTYPLPAGPTADVFKGGWTLPIAGAVGFENNRIVVDSTPDATGGIFASGAGGALVLCQGRVPKMTAVRWEEYGGGATKVFHRDEYAYGERSSGNWLFPITSDATAPSS